MGPLDSHSKVSFGLQLTLPIHLHDFSYFFTCKYNNTIIILTLIPPLNSKGCILVQAKSGDIMKDGCKWIKVLFNFVN